VITKNGSPLLEMTVTERRALEVLRDPALNLVSEAVDDNYESDGYGTMVLDGMEPIEVSHAGGEFEELTSRLLGDIWQRREITRNSIRKPDCF